MSALYLPAVYGQVAEKKLTFDVPYGQYETLLRHNVKGEGQLTCKVVTDQQNRGEKWVPTVILAAAETRPRTIRCFFPAMRPLALTSGVSTCVRSTRRSRL